jgi:agmatine/peptidylarginine deiminase
MRRGTYLLIALATLAACGETGQFAPPVPVEADKAQVAEPAYLHPAILPAHRLPGEEKVPGKDDAATDYRKSHPQWFAITEGPKGNVRPMKEWEPMKAMVMTYTNSIQYDGPVALTMRESIAGALNAGEVWVISNSASTQQGLIDDLVDMGVKQSMIDDRLKFYDIDHDSIWHIDYGPLPLVNEDDQTVAFGDFIYYHQRYKDDAIPTRLGNAVNTVTYRSPFEFEGGNFQADGEEFCYFGERTYYYSGMTYDDVNSVMQEYYGCKEAVVLKEITDDGTGHIDMFFKLGGKHVAFVGDYTVVNDPTNEARMNDNAKSLESMQYADGSGGITVYRIPFPHKQANTPMTYINSTLYLSADGSYGVNLWPMYTFDKDLEAQALQVWEEGLPDFDHVGVVSDKIALYSGAVHCVTRTIPALPFAKWVADGECEEGVCATEGVGYTGVCIPNTEDYPGCWGPAWECLCNDCNVSSCNVPDSCGDQDCGPMEGCFNCPEDCGCPFGQQCNLFTGNCSTSACGDGVCSDDENCASCDKDCGCSGGKECAFGICVSDPCGDITYDGCCDGDTLVYCDNGELVVGPCGGEGCGWLSENSWYDCGGNGEDPSGELPLSCFDYGYPPGCDGKECGDNGGGYSCGECPGGQACTPQGTCGECTGDCTGLECGDDGCGGNCGVCAAGETCVEGLCECKPDCTGLDCGPDGCGGTCGECVDPCTGEANFHLCEEGACVEPDCCPDCEGLECGDDGCGGSCGECDPGECEEGLCVCTPECGDALCGDDGCGGSCGQCEAGFACEEGTCVEEGTDPVDQGGEEGDVVAQPDTTGEEEGGGGGGGKCSAGPAGNPYGVFLILGLLLALAVIRRPTMVRPV